MMRLSAGASAATPTGATPGLGAQLDNDRVFDANAMEPLMPERPSVAQREMPGAF